MQNTKMTIEEIGKLGASEAAADAKRKAIYAENGDGEYVYCVTLSGAHDRKYYFVMQLPGLDATRVLVDGDTLIVCFWSKIVIVDIAADRIRNVIAVTEYPDMFGIHKFKGGYFVHGEVCNRYFDGTFDLLWESCGRDIFFCPTRENSIKIDAAMFMFGILTATNMSMTKAES